MGFAGDNNRTIGSPILTGKNYNACMVFTLLGVPAEIGATATILTRILTFWLRFFLGFLAQQWVEIKSINTSANTTKGQKPIRKLVTNLLRVW